MFEGGEREADLLVHALSVRREEVNIVAGRDAQKDKTKWVRGAQKDKMSPPLSGRGSVLHSMVGMYTQARQRRLRGKIVKY